MQILKKYFYLSGILAILLFACKKEKDKEPPVIVLTSPLENEVFDVNEDIHLDGTISDETAITGAAVSLLDEQGMLAHVTRPIKIKALTTDIDMDYLLDNIHLESGRYQLRVFASDGVNDSYIVRYVNIRATPKVLKKIVVTTAVNATQTNLFTVDTTSNALNANQVFSGDHLATAVNSYYQLLYHCGKFTGHLKGTTLENNSVILDVAPTIASPVPYFTDFYTSDNVNFVSFYEKQIRGYEQLSGALIYNANAMDNFYPQHLCMNGKVLIAEEQHKLTAEKKLVTFYSTGDAQQSCDLHQDVIAFCEKDDAHVFVFGNQAGQGIIQLFDRFANNLWSPYPYSLAAGSINSAVKLDANTYLIAHSNGTIYKYEYSSSSVTTYLTGYAVVQLLIDNVSNTLYVVEKNKISTFEPKTLKPLRTITSPEPILEIDLLYNR